MKPQLSKLTLTGHITFSVGWLGAVAVFLVLAIVGLTDTNVTTARSAYIAMELSGWYIIVPFCLASLATGIIQAVGTKWGLFQYYWVSVKFFLTIFITVFLLLHMQPIAYLAGLATESNLSGNEEYSLRVQVIADAGAAILALLFITTISVYKPWGLIKRKNKSNTIQSDNKRTIKRSVGLYILIALIALILLVVLKHLSGGGMGH